MPRLIPCTKKVIRDTCPPSTGDQHRYALVRLCCSETFCHRKMRGFALAYTEGLVKRKVAGVGAVLYAPLPSSFFPLPSSLLLLTSKLSSLLPLTSYFNSLLPSSLFPLTSNTPPLRYIKGILLPILFTISRLTFFAEYAILSFAIKYLIKSGGGTGPMKPGNLHYERCQIQRINPKMRFKHIV